MVVNSGDTGCEVGTHCAVQRRAPGAYTFKPEAIYSMQRDNTRTEAVTRAQEPGTRPVPPRSQIIQKKNVLHSHLSANMLNIVCVNYNGRHFRGSDLQ